MRQRARVELGRSLRGGVPSATRVAMSTPLRMSLLIGSVGFVSAASAVSTVARATLPAPGGGIYTIAVRQGDITREDADVIVNAANRHLQHGGGVAGAISRRGGPTIQAESDAYVAQRGPLADGDVAVTSAGALAARHVVHAVGPIWHGGGYDEEATLQRAVRNSLRAADELGASSVALPAISSGIFGFPKERCADIMVDTAAEFFQQPSTPKASLREIRCWEEEDAKNGGELDLIKHTNTTLRRLTNVDAETVGIFQRKLQRRFPAGHKTEL